MATKSIFKTPSEGIPAFAIVWHSNGEVGIEFKNARTKTTEEMNAFHFLSLLAKKIEENK